MFFKRTLVVIALLLIPVFVRAEGPPEDDHGWSFAQRFFGISNASGLILKTSSTATFSFNANIKAYAGLPVYFARQSSATTSNPSFVNGIGNAYSGLLVTAGGPGLRYTSDLIGTIPTGDSSQGFSTGKATIDWSNTFSRTMGSFIPYGSIGIANTVSDTSFFVRPFTSSGIVAHYEAGGILNVNKHVQAGGSFYGIRATGEQTIITKAVDKQVTVPATTSTSSSSPSSGAAVPHIATPTTPIATPPVTTPPTTSTGPTTPTTSTTPTTPTTSTGPTTPTTTALPTTPTSILPTVTNAAGNPLGNGNAGGNGNGNGEPFVTVIETTQQKTIVPASVLNDHGFSTWLSLKASPTTDFQIGYSRSQTYQFNSVFFGVGFHLGHYAIVK